MTDHTATATASVYADTEGWSLDLADSAGEVVETINLPWAGGDFQQDGLDVVAPLLNARGLRYKNWAALGGRYVAVLHRPASWGPR